jgi:hypothetical protein
MSSKDLVRRAVSLALFSLFLILIIPRRANAYVDPGGGAIVWQAAAAACIGSLFYLHRVARWVGRHLGVRSPRTLGFVFATSYAFVASPVVRSLFLRYQLPRFGDIYLLGVVLTAYLFTWEGAAYLLVIAVVVSAWILPPSGTLSVASAADQYRITSFTVISLFLICLITRLKTRRGNSTVQQAPQ